VVNHSVAAGSSVGVRWSGVAPDPLTGALTLENKGNMSLPGFHLRWMGAPPG